jgi:putative secretion ATPase (PEP-CTERM system associated)
MFEAFYNLAGPPFQLAPDHRFYFASQEHKKAMAFLKYGIAQQEGFVVVTGEVGAGKTTLIELLLANLDTGKYVAGRIASTQVDGYELLCMIAEAFGVPSDGAAKATLIGRIRQNFEMLHRQGTRPLIIVDEAQALSGEAIEELRMLSNIAQGAKVPFQCVLLGQPKFRTALSDPQSEQFRQRVIASCHLGALGMDDTRKYIEHRLALVGWKDDPQIFDDAFEEIHRCSGGVPRRINILVSRLLLLGFLEEKHSIEAHAVRSVARELEIELGPLHGPAETERSNGATLGAAIDRVYEELQSRLRKVERMCDRQNRVTKRALSLAHKYLQGRNSK